MPVWGTPAKLVKSKDPKPGCWHLVFLDDADQKGTSSFHDITYSGMPIAKVFVRPAKKSGEVISVTACHELLEMLVDPSAALWTDGPRGTVWAYEVCDVVEDDKIDFNGIQMSDFVYPAYFDMFRLKKGAKPAQYDYLKKVQAAVPDSRWRVFGYSQERARSPRNGVRRKRRNTFIAGGSALSSQSIPQETAQIPWKEKSRRK